MGLSRRQFTKEFRLAAVRRLEEGVSFPQDPGLISRVRSLTWHAIRGKHGQHCVVAGECMLSFAYDRGFFRQTLWNHPANAVLHAARPDPGQLVVGDRVMIPERQTKALPANTDVRQQYVKRGVNAKVRLVVEYEDFPVSNAHYAKLLQAPSPSANTIAGLITPDYASPEQVRGKSTSTLTDVYALGVLLYELLAGRRPFEAKADRLHETLRQICEDEPLRPSMAGSKKELRGDLDTIVLKALRKEPDRRYASVEQLDEDLWRMSRADRRNRSAGAPRASGYVPRIERPRRNTSAAMRSAASESCKS